MSPPFSIVHLSFRQPHLCWLAGALLVLLPGLPTLAGEPLPDLPPEVLEKLERHAQQVPDTRRQTDSERRQTVARALENLESSNPDHRRAAVMLLGKYNLYEARQAVIESLSDEDASVRLAAIVSLFESHSRLSREAELKVFLMIADDDAAIRRIATNVLPFTLSSFPVSYDRSRGRPERNLPPRYHEKILRAFQDGDTIVRRNMMSHYSRLYVDVPDEILIERMHDEDQEVATLALQVGRNALSREDFARETRTLAGKGDRPYRLTMVRLLRNHTNEDALQALETLSGDENRQIRLEAQLQLFRANPETSRYESLLEELQTGRLFPDTTEEILMAATTLGSDGAAYLKSGLTHSSSLFRRLSSDLLFRYYTREVAFSDLEKLLEDSDREIRQRSRQFWHRHSHRWSGEDILAVSRSPRPGNRLAALQLSSRLSDEKARDLVLEMLLDDHRDVQAEAVAQVGEMKFSGWESILYRATRASAEEVRFNALRGLMQSPSPKGLEYLEKFVAANPDFIHTPQIRQFLKNHNP